MLVLLRPAPAVLEYFLWVRSGLPRSKHSLSQSADLKTSAQPRDEGIGFTQSLVVVGGKHSPAGAGRCRKHNDASPRAASSRRTISAVQHRACVPKNGVSVQRRLRQMRRQDASLVASRFGAISRGSRGRLGRRDSNLRIRNLCPAGLLLSCLAEWQIVQAPAAGSGARSAATLRAAR